MAISTSNISRVSQSLQTVTLLSQLRQNAMRLLVGQEQISTGKRLLSVGDDPIAAAQVLRLGQSLLSQDQILTNLQHADSQLGAADSALSEIGDMLTQASRIASEQAGTFQSAEERRAQATVIDGIISQLVNVGNRQFQGQYLFGGRQVNRPPLDGSAGGVTFAGDGGDRSTLVDTLLSMAYNVTVSDVFNLRDKVTGGAVDFDVQLASDARVADLAGALNRGVKLGPMAVTEVGPGTAFQVDFSGADTVGDLIATFNDAAAVAGSSLSLGISPADGGALRITSGLGNGVSVGEVGSGTTAADLGIKKTVGAGVPLDGDAVNRRVTLTTPLAQLQPGGVALAGGVSITNGAKSATVSFAGATTVQDLLNRLNGAAVGIRAAISGDGNRITIENLVAGSPLVVGENGGTDAATLGIKTLDGSVLLARLNGYRGIHPVSGADFQVTNANGVSFQVDLSTAQTVNDAINAINAASTAAGAGIVGQVSDGGAGLRLTGPAGPGSITVDSLNLSPVAGELGILKTGTATVLEGDNVGAFRQTGVFSALYRLRDALLADDSTEIAEAGSQITEAQQHVSTIAGTVGARAQGMKARLDQTQTAVIATRTLISQLSDVDFTEAVTKFQQAQTALQANLLSGSKIANLSLLDFLQ